MARRPAGVIRRASRYEPRYEPGGDLIPGLDPRSDAQARAATYRPDMETLVIGLVALAVLVGSQLAKKPLSGSFRLPVILAVVGLFEVASFLRDHHGGSLVAPLAGSLALAAVTGALRAPTVRLWVQDTQVWRQGTWLTAVLWIASLAAHLGYDALVTHGKADASVGTATIVAYFAVSQGVQRLLLAARAARLTGVGGAVHGRLWASSGQVPGTGTGR